MTPMFDVLERLKAILSEDLTETEVQTIMSKLTIASGNGSVVFEESAGAVAVTGNQSIVGDNNIGDNNRIIINHGIKREEVFRICDGFFQKIQQNSVLSFPEIHKFDLDHLIKECLKKLLTKKGLVGLIIPCDEKLFLKNFCVRLKHELGTKNTQIRSTVALKPQITSVGKAVGKIRQYQKLLETSNVICPIRADICNSSSTIAEDFWKQLKNSFKSELNHWLIIVIVGDQSCVFPSDLDVLYLPRPQFGKADAFQWICRITQVLNWMHLNEKWMQKMIDSCLYDEAQPELLDIGMVYEHLDYTLSLLQQNPPLSAEAFLERLD